MARVGIIPRSSGKSAPAPASQAPKLVQTFDTAQDTTAGSLLKVSGANAVASISSNAVAEIPNGIFGVAVSKPTSTTVDVLFIGILGGFSSLTPGAPVYVSAAGTPTTTPPPGGVLQQIGFSVSSTQIFFIPQQAVART